MSQKSCPDGTARPASSDPLSASTPGESSGESTGSPFELLVVTGLSGAGKSTALQVLEDLGFFTADGLPPETIPDFCAVLMKPGLEHFRGLAVGPDFHRHDATASLDRALGRVRSMGGHVAVIFLEARSEEILRRYSTTRRPHPLEREGLGLNDAMAEEVRRMALVRNGADLVLDTSSFSIHDLRRAIQQRYGEAASASPGIRVNLVSFGFKYGMPTDADMVFDLRFLPNPYFDPELRPLSGKDKVVADYVFAQPEARLFREKLLDFLLFTVPLYDAEGRYRLTVGMGCTGGRHRSVAMTELAAHALAQAGYTVTVTHKHLELG